MLVFTFQLTHFIETGMRASMNSAPAAFDNIQNEVNNGIPKIKKIL